jgi:ABC-2 type transport system permease protein
MLSFKALAFIKRDFRIESSYKLNYVMRAIESLMLLLFFYFLSELIAQGNTSALAKYGGRYLPYAVIGLAFARYFDLALRMFSESIRTAQMTGCLEAMLSSQTDCVTIVLMSSLYGLISGTIQLILILGAGAMLLGVNFSQMNIPATILVFVISVLAFVSFGILSAAAIVWLKKGDPVAWIFGSFGAILGGAYFPIEVMPGWVQKAALLVPITYSLEALRLTMLRGYSIAMITKPLIVLSSIALLLLPFSLILFAAMVQKGRKEGTLTEY